ncbi:hypothetical protein N9I04_00085 [Alphaproteobacteria bacterium]|nr:hypothetical protein [Alphaproteobacteria bacterium]
MAERKTGLYEQIKKGELVHPLRATDWNRFFQLIKSKLPNGVDIPNPLILGGAGASNYSKNQRLQEHLRIAEEHGLLQLALTMLSKIPEDKWVTSGGNLDPNEPSYWELEEQHQREIHSKWFFKPIEMLQTNLATIDENQEGKILFVVETGWVFDELCYPDNETAERKLRLNGFKRCDEDPVFETLSFIPDTLHEGARNPVYSSGKHWRE